MMCEFHDTLVDPDDECPLCLKAWEEFERWAARNVAVPVRFPAYCSGCGSRHDPDACPYRGAL